MAQGKQAKILTVKQEAFILHHLTTTRYPLRDRAMFLLSMKAGLRAKEMAALTWSMVTEADGQVGETLHLVNAASKGETGGRSIPLHRDLRTVLVELAQAQRARRDLDRPVLRSERGGGLSAASVQGWFQRLYETLELAGCSSHSGRRTFITRAARKVSEVGGSLRDVQQLAGHSSLATTQRYIEGDTDAKRKLIQML